MSIEDVLSQIVNEGYNISIEGPDVTKITPAYRWSLRVYTNERDAYSYPLDKEIFHGESMLNVLQQCMTWIEQRPEVHP